MPIQDKDALFSARLLDALGSSDTPSQLALVAARTLVELGAMWCSIWLIRSSESEPLLAGLHHREEAKIPLLERLVTGWPTRRETAFWSKVVERQKPLHVEIQDTRQAAEVFGSQDRCLVATRLESPSFELVPLVHRGATLGVLAIAPGTERAVAIPEISGHLTTALAMIENACDRREFDRQREEIIGMVSHELKTPLTSLKSSAQLLRRRSRGMHTGAVGEELDEILEIVERQTNRLARLANDMVLFSSIRAGLLELEKSKFSMGTLASEVVSSMWSRISDRRLEILVTNEALVVADRQHIGHALADLISNAIKVTAPSGKITVAVREHKGLVIVSVHDEGPGVPPEVEELLFEGFYRGPNQRHEGMGLGLYVAKSIIEAHGGRIWLESESGKGTTFFFSLAKADSH